MTPIELSLDLAAIKNRRQKAWATGDDAAVEARLVVPNTSKP